ncbi:MAG: permease, partial [Verrucomicrobiota bacterium]
LAGLMLDLCNHGILMVGMQLYRRGASLGQTMAFLIASPWNSLSLTIILVALIGWKWTLIFILLSAIIALTSGMLFEIAVKRKLLPANQNTIELPEDFHFLAEARKSFSQWRPSATNIVRILKDGLIESRMILRWIFFGIVLVGLIRVLIPETFYQAWFGPSIMGLGLTLLATTVLEVCSEGSSPIAADLVNRANAPGNGFTFLMAGAATDYTEIMALKETTHSWKISLALPLITVPQILLVGYLLN